MEHFPYFARDLHPNIYVGLVKEKSPLEAIDVEKTLNSTENNSISSNTEMWQEEEVGLARFFETLPSNFPIHSVLTKGTEYYVTTFIHYEQDKSLVYFAVEDNNIVAIRGCEIDGIILGKPEF